jgi:hypothetical protein
MGSIDKHGYRVFSSNGRQTAEHRLVMEQALGRKLRADETIHHKNGKRLDNRPENLEVWASRHGRGERVEDLVAHAVELLLDYADFITPEQLDDLEDLFRRRVELPVTPEAPVGHALPLVDVGPVQAKDK